MTNIIDKERNIYEWLIIFLISGFIMDFIELILIKFDISNLYLKNILNSDFLILSFQGFLLLIFLVLYSIYFLIMYSVIYIKIYKNYNFYLKNEQNINLSKDSFQKILKYNKYQKYCIIFYLFLIIFLNFSVIYDNKTTISIVNSINIISFDPWYIILDFTILYLQYLKMKILKKENIYI